MKIKWIITLVTLTLVGCNDNRQLMVNYPVALKANDIIRLHITETSKFSPFTLQYVTKQDQQYLLCDNQFEKSIDVYDLESKLFFKRIFVNDSIREYQETLHGFWALSVDTIFTYSKFKLGYTSIVLEDWDVKERKSVAIQNPSNKSSFFNHASMTVSPSVVVSGSIYFSELPLANISELVNTAYSPEILYDLATKNTRRSGIYWPQVYQKGRWGNLFLYTKTFDDQGRILYSWQASDSLMVNNQDSIFSVSAASDFFDNPVSYDYSLAKPGGVDANLIIQNQYMAVLYDRYRKVYYRYAMHGIEEKLNDGSPAYVFDRPFSIIILDELFNKIGETRFEGGKYLTKDSFVGKDGLYISMHNRRQYEKIGEDQMVFQLMNLQYNE